MKYDDFFDDEEEGDEGMDEEGEDMMDQGETDTLCMGLHVEAEGRME
jgi:hypothetical protein